MKLEEFKQEIDSMGIPCFLKYRDPLGSKREHPSDKISWQFVEQTRKADWEFVESPLIVDLDKDVVYTIMGMDNLGNTVHEMVKGRDLQDYQMTITAGMSDAEKNIQMVDPQAFAIKIAPEILHTKRQYAENYLIEGFLQKTGLQLSHVSTDIILSRMKADKADITSQQASLAFRDALNESLKKTGLVMVS